MPATGGFITLQICGDGTVRVVNKAIGGVYIAPTFEEANGTDERIRASSVLTPHGKLVDTDEVAAQLQEMSEVVEDVYPLDKKERQQGIERGLRDARRFVMELAPSVIEMEE